MSTSSVLDLWSDDIRVDILTPLMILRAQVRALGSKVDGLLVAEVRTEVSQRNAEHSLDLIAPVLNAYRITLLVTWHDTELIYPARVKSRGLLPPNVIEVIENSYAPPPQSSADERLASSQEGFIQIISEILKSGWVRSLMQSLIARSQEILADKRAKGNGESTTNE